MKKKSSTKDLGLSSNESLFLNNKSVFRPKSYSNIKPNCFKIYTFHAGFKKKYDDLLIIIFDQVVNSATVYSKTSTPSSPIIWDKKNNKGKVRALIVNSGNANAHTGSKGIKIIDNYVKKLTDLLRCKKSEILVSSTGVIGEIFDPKLIIKKINLINNKKSTNLIDAAKSIMTTDTYPKLSYKKVKIKNRVINIYGIAKGSGMIHPNMGTMLSYIFIETKLSTKILKKLLLDNIESTFNSISVDSDTSTSDTLSLFSINKTSINFDNKENFKKLSIALNMLMKDLSLQIVKDGEGLSKLICVKVVNSKSKIDAKNIALSVVNSPLVKTAISGEDANWGRIIMAIGKSYANIKQDKIKIMIGKNVICSEGSKNNKINLKVLNKYMKNKKIEITININNGNYNFTAYGNDLTYKYIKINADYRS
tara:strand:- start:1291 stop:2556 length:1266 start_codon:yes stop_codon:yes gene_type:complete